LEAFSTKFLRICFSLEKQRKMETRVSLENAHQALSKDTLFVIWGCLVD
jgi:hypothetical protein